MNEVWKPIPGHGGYEASDQGRVRSVERLVDHGKGGSKRKIKGRVLRPVCNKKTGRRFVSLGKHAGKFPVAMLVGMAFLGLEQNGKAGSVVDHIDNDCTNDVLSNLQVITHRENIAKGYSRKKKKSGLPTGVSRTVRNKKPYRVSMFIDGKNKHIGAFYTIEEASDAYWKKVSEIKSSGEVK